MNTTNTETRRSLMQDTVARRIGRQWWLMNTKAKGFSSSAIGPYSSTLELFQDWAITVGDLGSDEHGEYIEIHAQKEVR